MSCQQPRPSRPHDEVRLQTTPDGTVPPTDGSSREEPHYNPPERPEVSSHAELRLLQRGGVDAWPVSKVWRNASPVTLEARHYHHAKYSETFDVVLIEYYGVIVTVLRGAYEEFSGVAG